MTKQIQDEYEELTKISVDTNSPTILFVIPSSEKNKQTQQNTNENETIKPEKDPILINSSNCQAKTNLDQVNSSKCCLII